MNAPALARNAPSPSRAHKTLGAAAALWFVTALLGQCAFVAYVVSFYGGTAMARRFDKWNEVLVGGYVRGGLTGNVALSAHLLFAVVITVAGLVQLIPQLRQRAPALHRWNGRLYLVTAFVVTLSGLYAVWTRGSAGGLSMRIGVSGDGLFILVSATLALRHARARRMASHRRWALRTFVLASGVWFFRVGLMLWILVLGGPVGVGDHFDGPFVRTWTFGCYVVPLLVLQLYLYAQAHPGAAQKYLTAVLLACLAIATGVGIVGALLAMWLPHMGGT
jgi:uncharacterized membrane protein